MEEEIKEETESNNEIIEITDEEETKTENLVYDTMPTEIVTQKKKEKKPNKWQNLSKKQKIIIICCLCVVLLVIIALLLYFLVFKKDSKSKKETEPEVIVEKYNYRYENGTLIFLDNNKKELGKYDCENKDQNKCYIAYYNNDDDFDITKRMYEDGTSLKETSDILSEKYVFIFDNDDKENIKLYDLEEKKVLGEYLGVKLINEFTVMVQDLNEKYGILSLKNEVSEVIDFKYDYLGLIPEQETLVAKIDSNSKLIDFEGKDVTKEIKGDIRNFDDNYLSVYNNDVYYLYDYNGNKVLPKSSDFITFKNGYVFVINAQKMYVYDDAINLLNYEGIALNSNNYVKKVIFDKFDKEIKREETFDLTTSEGIVVITDGDLETKINAYEGKLSSKYKFVSYYNGLLYLFKDAEKNNLLGTYKCSNPNEVKKNTTEFTKCFIGKETALLNRSVTSRETGYLPIFNNRFVFVNDTKDNNPNIVLYDLTKKEPKATYQAVDAGYYHNNNELGFETTTDRVLMARNTSGNYGLVKVENSNVTGLISFKDDANGGATKSIKLMNNYYVVIRADDRYYLYPLTGGKNPLASASKEIIAYQDGKALKTLKDNKYGVVDLKGKVLNDNLLYVELYDNYYVAIDEDRMINVYNYDSNTGLIKETVIVNATNNYADTYTFIDANTIRINNQNYSLTTGEVQDED